MKWETRCQKARQLIDVCARFQNDFQFSRVSSVWHFNKIENDCSLYRRIVIFFWVLLLVIVMHHGWVLVRARQHSPDVSKCGKSINRRRVHLLTQMHALPGGWIIKFIEQPFISHSRVLPRSSKRFGVCKRFIIMFLSLALEISCESIVGWVWLWHMVFAVRKPDRVISSNWKH